MGKTNLGRVAFVPRGAYNNEVAYKRLDVVEYEGSSYLFLKDSTGITPTGDGEVTMLLAKKGKDFIYDDFTPEQLAALKGANGKDGVNGADGTKGDKGDPGKGLTILGYYGTLDLLKATITTPEPGDAYGIGEVALYDIYVFDGVKNDWVNNGKLSGSSGEGGGNVVFIPVEVMELSNSSTSEEVLAAWGDRDNLISICKQIHDSKAICKFYGGDENSSASYLMTAISTEYTDDNNASIVLYVGAGSSSLMLQTSLANGVASCNVKAQAPVISTKLPDAIFDLTSQSTSEQILNVFGGIDKIKDIYNKIGSSDILIAHDNYSGNGYSVLHNFGGSYIDLSQNNGFDRKIYFAYTSIEPAIEITRWVIKFNNNTATCEVTKKEVGGEANILFIPVDVLELNSTSTSNDIIEAFGGRTALNGIIDKAKIGDAITVIKTPSANISCAFSLNPYADYNDFDLYLESFMEHAAINITIVSQGGVLRVNEKNIDYLLGHTMLVSDPSVGGTDKPASAEAVKKVNDKTYISQRFSTTMGDTKYAILLCKLIDTVDEHIVINGWISGIETESSSAIMQAIKIDFSVLNSILYGTEAYRTAVGIGYYQSMNKPSLCTCVYKEHTWLALDVFNWAGENLSVFNGISNVKLTLESVAYASYDGEFFTIVDHEIENSITILNKNFTKLNAT